MLLNISSRGLLTEEGKVLFIKYTIDNETYYSLPGGTVEVGENLSDCVKREFLEETAINIDVGSLILVNEFIDSIPTAVAPSWKDGIHQIETIFEVNRNIESAEHSSPQPDYGMEGIRWMDAQKMESVTYYPKMPIDWFFAAKHKNLELYKSEERL